MYLAVDVTAFKKLFMSAAAYAFAVLENDYLIAMRDSTRALRDVENSRRKGKSG